MMRSSGSSPTPCSTSSWRTDVTFGRGLRSLSIATAVLITGAFALVFFYAPNDADQGFIQKIFYLHVPMAIVALCGFVAGGIYGLRFLRTGDRAHDLRSYVAVRMAESLTHPRVLSTTGGAMPGDMRLTFYVSLAGFICLFVTLWKYELASKSASIRLRSLRRRLAGDDALVPLNRSASPQQL